SSRNPMLPNSLHSSSAPSTSVLRLCWPEPVKQPPARSTVMIKRLAISCAACIAATSACISLSCPGFRSNTTGQPTRQELLPRHQILARIVEQIDQRNLGAARVTAQSLVDAPLVPEEIIQGRRLLATIAQRQRDFPEA